jgi:ubiquinone/menaquinone biosynthesis C-methylase UbiE
MSNEMSNQALHKMNPQSRFTSRAEDYAKYRPSYPDAVIDCIVAELGNLSNSVAADIGAGTGISSRLLANRGIRVMAIEPNAAMSKAALPHPLVEFMDGSAENTGLSDASVDLITCFQAFHWFNPEPTLKEFARILKPKGKVALVWNDRNVDGKDRFTLEHDRILTKASNNNPVHSRLNGKSSLEINSWFDQVKHYSFAYQQVFDRDSLIGLAMSASYIPKAGTAHQQLIAELTDLHRQYCDNKGLVYLQYQTSLYLSN